MAQNVEFMKKWSRFENSVLAVTLLFVLTGLACFAVGQQSADNWRVKTQRSGQLDAAVSEREKTEWPDSLLEGETINVNTAPAAELERLPGVGAVRARAIEKDRERNGSFSTVDELIRVEGIGTGIMEQLRPYVTVG